MYKTAYRNRLHFQDRLTIVDRRIKNGIGKILLIHKLCNEDSGDYKCILTNKNSAAEIRNNVQQLKVSRTKGQLKVENVSDTTNWIEGDTVHLGHFAKSNPGYEYRSEWRKVCVFKKIIY